MAKPKAAAGQTSMSDMLLEMQETDTYILVTVNGDDVSVWSTLESDTDAALYLQVAAKAVMADD